MRTSVSSVYSVGSLLTCRNQQRYFIRRDGRQTVGIPGPPTGDGSYLAKFLVSPFLSGPYDLMRNQQNKNPPGERR